MKYELIPSRFFLEQLDGLSKESKKLIESKLLLVKTNPYRFKKLEGFKLFLFRIRFQDNKKEKRVIYLVDKPKVKILCIIDRDNDYKDLRSFLKRHNYHNS